jgi:hypothetical protein
MKLFGIDCTLSRKDRAQVNAALERIRQRRPSDFLEIKRLVRLIAPYTGDDDECGGQWVSDNGDCDRTPGVVYLRSGASAATIAHELGHAMTRYEDIWRRNCSFNSEWASELAADWYAYRWGFGREIAASRKGRHFAHHCVGPGQTIEVEIDGGAYRYRVTRNFCLKEGGARD